VALPRTHILLELSKQWSLSCKTFVGVRRALMHFLDIVALSHSLALSALVDFRTALIHNYVALCLAYSGSALDPHPEGTGQAVFLPHSFAQCDLCWFFRTALILFFFLSIFLAG
jgi:hypothetical protein